MARQARDEREERRLRGARQWLKEEEHEPTDAARASDYFDHLPEYRKKFPHLNAFVGVVRASDSRDADKHQDDAEEQMRADAAHHGCTLIEVFRERKRGHVPPDKRKTLLMAAACARKHGVPLLFISRNRALRRKGYDGTLDSDYVTEADLRAFKDAVGVDVVTILHPDAQEEDDPKKRERSNDTRRGHAHGGKPGRPSKDQPKRTKTEVLTSRVLALHKRGLSTRAIARELKKGRRTLSHQSVWKLLRSVGDL